ncbi:MAG: RDD family protein [candidate division WOR-3 bacterium]|nr:RDD family protein [candidate division WOR-3 bacterium]MCX7757874.1 RDD family protein [candidate division WOR-3 bacterium]MDW7987670.1 RDD family protein [candidate division WOR-3 bacterium]
MYCRNCGKEITEKETMCGVCGCMPLVGNKYCPSCGSAVETQAMICVNCGVRLFNIRYAGFNLRFVAYLLDFLVLFIPGIIIFKIAPFTSGLILLMVNWLYFSLMESSKLQATLGKLALKIVVTDIKGNPVTFERASARYFAKILSTLTLGVGFILAGFTPRKQALHDIITGCLVIKK